MIFHAIVTPLSDCDFFERQFCSALIFVGNRRVNQGKSADSAEIHQDDQNKLRKNTELRCDSKGKSDRSDSGRRFVKAGAERQTFCRADNNAADKNSRKYITATVAAFFTAEPSMRLPQTSASSFLRQTENALRIRTASVVVFIHIPKPGGGKAFLPVACGRG